MLKTTITAEGQISIPKVLRERLNLEAGTEVSIDVQGEALVLKRLVGDYPDWRTMRGMFKGEGDLLQELMDERAADIAHDDARIKGS